MSIHLDKLKAYDVETGGCEEENEDDERMRDKRQEDERPALSARTSSNASEAVQHHRASTILRAHPLLLVGPTLLLLIIIALCVFGVTYATNIRIDTQRELAKVEAQDSADALRLQLSVTASAALTLATFVQVNPDWNTLEENFVPASKEIFRQANETSPYQLAELLYLPFGKAAANYAPPEFYRGPIRTDIFSEEVIDRAKPYLTLELGGMTLTGPIPLTNPNPSIGGRSAIIARYPVYIKNVSKDEDWNNPFNMTAPTGCTERCYDESTRTKFWGFTTAFFYADELTAGEDERLRQLVDDAGFEYRLSKSSNISHPVPYDQQEVVVKSKGWEGLEPTAVVDVNVPGAAWYLAVHDPEIDDMEDERDGLIALIVIVAFLLSGLLLMLLVSNKRASLLLDEQLVTNNALERANEHLTKTKRVLEEEKQQRETLLGRQYQLISCFEGREGNRKLSSSVADKQSATIGQITALRHAMDEDRRRQHASSANDDIQFFEILGEGTFGKVHRGSWRSTQVAIKTILLPANMSGAEKREKMVVWEAAISSSLTHPNIVQMYTYSIKPVREQDKQSNSQRSFNDGTSCLGSAVQICGDGEEGIKPVSSTVRGSSQKTTEGGAIHSFEVSLVLEYCDKGTLRAALDQNAFMSDTGLNYAGILDSAIDIARAMHCLHCNNILHMDLKAGNVLLSSCGPNEGRGVTCKASDFGLAVRMEQAETHMSGCFQGTLTHMAPETLLTGRVSKAADVYAFGILLWELFTGGQPYKGIPKALLGHKIVAERHRPPLPFVMPQGYKDLVQACWVQNADKRPSFAEILERLQALRNSIPGKTEPLGPICRPSPRAAESARKGPSRSLLAASEHSRHRRSVSAGAFERVRSTEYMPSHPIKPMPSVEHPSRIPSRSAEHSVRAPVRSAEELGHSAAHPSRSSDVAARTEGVKSSEDPGGSMAGVRKMVRFYSAGARDRDGRCVPEVSSFSDRRDGPCEGAVEEQGRCKEGEGGADGDGSREAGKSLRRCRSLPSMAGDEETSASGQVNSSPLLSDGTRSDGNSHSSHSIFLSSEECVSSGQGAELSSDGTWLPFAPKHLSGPADLEQMAHASHTGPQSGRGSMRSPFSQGSTSSSSSNGPSTSKRQHHHHSFPPARSLGYTSSSRLKPSRNRDHSCVMVIGGGDDEYRANLPKEGTQGRVELSSIRTMAALGNMLDPIGEEEERLA